ncbi:MAG: MFS transporter [Actinomycetota bacterium]|nr:MFS transporter [Actinomycetota bacterium]
MDLPETTYPSRGWIVPLAATVMVGFGVILYGFSVYATDQAAGADFSKTALSLAYGGSVFVGGLLALPVGRFADKHGVRVIVGAGAVLGSLGLAAFSISSQSWQVVLAWWVLIGPAQSMVYYQPSYIAIVQWSPARDRARALATITLIGGLAGIVFIPLAERLVSLFGWRPAVLTLALLLLVVGGVTAVFALPRRRTDVDEFATASGPDVSIFGLFRDRRFIVYTLALMLILMATQGVIAHRVARFEEVGFSLATVAMWAAIASALSLPGRWIAPMLADRLGATRVQAGIALVVAFSVMLMVDGTSSWQMIGHFFLFGLAFGALLPLRAMVMDGWFSGPSYGRIMGTQWTGVVLVAASGPVLVGILRDATGGYGVSTVILTALFLAAAAAIALSGREAASRESASHRGR